jgi:hypothetical protein
MASTATNRSAAFAGAWCAIGGLAFTKLIDLIHPSHDVLRWLIGLAVLVLIFFVPFFRWVIGVDIRPRAEGFSLPSLPPAYARIGIWVISGTAVGVVVNLAMSVVSK